MYRHLCRPDVCFISCQILISSLLNYSTYSTQKETLSRNNNSKAFKLEKAYLVKSDDKWWCWIIISFLLFIRISQIYVSLYIKRKNEKLNSEQKIILTQKYIQVCWIFYLGSTICVRQNMTRKMKFLPQNGVLLIFLGTEI